ncbi:MAG TPA: hypothetical protein VHB48_18585, partial [Chitinophagaceae bacterium]|nr:hypothetical protein [Chitinophagaceae bacterium]
MHSILKITCVLLLVACAACTRQAKDLLTWRWSFEGVYMNGEERFIDSISNGEDKDEALRNFFM